MKVVTVFEWNRDPQDVRLDVNGAVTWGGARMSPSDDDPAVMEVANALASEEEIVGITVGDGDLAWAAARGAGSTVCVSDAESDVDGAALASVLVSAIRAQGNVDAVLVGDSDWDRAVVSALAGRLGLPAFAGVTTVDAAGEGALRISCKSGSDVTVMEVPTPVLLAVKGMSAEKNVPGMRQVLAARKKPKEEMHVADLADVRPSAAQVAQTRPPDTPPAVIIDGTDPKAASEQLVAALYGEGVL